MRTRAALAMAILVVAGLGAGAALAGGGGSAAGEAPAGPPEARIESAPAANSFAGRSARAGSRAVRRAFVAGRSVAGRPIRVRRLGDPAASRSALVVGSIHGDETQGHRVVARLRRLAARRIGALDLWTVVTVNPDGVARRTRKNARGIDLNRNFSHRFDPTLAGGYESGPSPFSEPETRVVRQLVKRARPDLTVWYHQPWGRMVVPCNRSGKSARRYGRLSGLRVPSRCDAPLPGTAIGWQYARFGKPAFVAEFPARPLRRAEVRRHARAVIAVAKRPR